MKFKAFNEEEFKRDTDTIDLTNLEIVEEAIATLQESYFNKNDGFRRIEKVSLLAIHLLQQENKQLKDIRETAINYIDQVIMYKSCAREIDEELNTLIGILRGGNND